MIDKKYRFNSRFVVKDVHLKVIHILRHQQLPILKFKL